MGSTVRDGRHLILVIDGFDSAGQRSREAERLLEYGYREVTNYTLFHTGETVAETEIWLGDKATVPLAGYAFE